MSSAAVVIGALRVKGNLTHLCLSGLFYPQSLDESIHRFRGVWYISPISVEIDVEFI